MTLPEIKTVCFVGSGTMGCYNSLIAALAGYQVILYDVSAQNLAATDSKYTQLAEPMLAAGTISQQDFTLAMQRVTLSGDATTALGSADLVSESVFEQRDLKRKVLKVIENHCQPHCIITTNTSALLVSELDSALEDGGRFAALHSYLSIPLMDIVGGPRCETKILQTLVRYVKSLHCQPLLLNKEYPGYLLNALLGSFLTGAILLVANGEGTIEEIDRAWLAHSNGAMGPFGLMDYIGIKVIYDSWADEKTEAYEQVISKRVSAYLKPFVQRGELGMRTGKGFYGYPHASWQAPEFTQNKDIPKRLYKALSTAIIQRAILVYEAGVADREMIDQTWVTGVSIAKGPFTMFNEWGVTEFDALSKTTQAAIGLCSEEQMNAIQGFIDIAPQP
jgi:enoyl-CoA hydratase/3-hydroxyacyl-CoA dehydrogenase